MKRIFCLLLILVLVCACLPVITVGAESENLLSNPDFEKGTLGWSGSDVKGVVDSGRSGSKALRAVKTANAWFSAVQTIEGIIKTNGAGVYKASAYLKTADSVGDKAQVAIKFVRADGSATYSLSKAVTLSKSFQKTEVTFIASDTDFSRIDFYFYSGSDKLTELIIDDCSLTKVEEMEQSEKLDRQIQRPEQIRVGAIRWDAYFATKDVQKASSHTPAEQVARTLSYYPSMTPYYAQSKNRGYDLTIGFENVYETKGTTYTIDNVKKDGLPPLEIKYEYGVTWEEETKLALDAGIDYFAYVWYSDDDPMALPRKAHAATNGMLSDGRQMLMTFALQHGQFGQEVNLDKYDTDEKKAKAITTDHKQCYQAMAQSCFLSIDTKDGRIPVLFCYNAQDYTPDELRMIRKEAVFYTAYLEKINPEKYSHVNDVYLVAMGSAANSYNFMAEGFDAISRYGTSVTITGDKIETMDRYEYNDYELKKPKNVKVKSDPYTKLLAADLTTNMGYVAIKKQLDCIPGMAMGMCHLPRIKTSVSWTGDYGLQYIRVGEPEQIAMNLTNTLNVVKNNPDCTPANAILIYAWNEHDEGGYLCPTVKVDENGKPLFNEDGTFQMDSRVLDAVAGAIAAYKGIATPAPGATDAPQATDAPTASDKPQEKTGCGSLLALLPVSLLLPMGLVIRKRTKID